MPELCRFYGIIIRMFTDDHNPPHFHAFYNEYEALINIDNFSIIMGSLPPKAIGLVMEWAAMHKKELLDNWNLASSKKHTNKITPLQ